MLRIEVGGLTYKFERLSSNLFSQVEKHFGKFVVNSHKGFANERTYTVSKGFVNILAFKTFLRKKLSRDLLKYNKLMAHSAVFTLKGKAFIFLGESGDGKSTIIDKVKDFSTVFNDETNVIDVNNKIVYSTPFWGDNGLFSYNRHPFERIFVLKKLNKNCIEEINKRRALYYLLKTVLVDINSHKIKSLVFEVASQLVEKVNFYLFSYKLDTDLRHLLNKI